MSDDLRVHPETRLVHRGEEPLELCSGHHDLRARLTYDLDEFQRAGRLQARWNGLDPREHTVFDDLFQAVDLFEQTWPWAEFVLIKDEGNPGELHRPHATASAEPKASNDPPPYLTHRRRSSATEPNEGPEPPLAGNALLTPLVYDRDAGAWNCRSVELCRNRTGDVDQRRRRAAQGDGGYLVERR